MADIISEFKKFLTDTAMTIKTKYANCIPEDGILDIYAFKRDGGFPIRIDLRDKKKIYISYVMGLNDDQFKDDVEEMQIIYDNINETTRRERSMEQ